MDPNHMEGREVTNDDSESEMVEVSRREALGTTAKFGAMAAVAGLLGAGPAASALAASHDTTGKGKLTGWAGLSQGEVNVLRRVVVDPKFRVSFEQNPKAAIKASGEKMTAAQISNLSRATKLQVENFVTYATIDMKTDSTGGTHTLLHAIAYAVLIAILLAVQGQEGAPTAGGAVPIA